MVSLTLDKIAVVTVYTVAAVVHVARGGTAGLVEEWDIDAPPYRSFNLWWQRGRPSGCDPWRCRRPSTTSRIWEGALYPQFLPKCRRL